MKKIIFLCLAALISSTLIFAKATPDAQEKILKLFHHDFPGAQNELFHDYGDSYMVYFKMNENSSGRVFYNLDGTIQQTVRYYSTIDLDPFIRAKVEEKYKGKTIYGVTEVASNDQRFYQIVLQNNKSWYIVDSDASGNMTLEKKFNKT